ncbi:MAG: SRPBCC family protein [Actinomycetota bacterium]|nr:SRPBCC family protein [Actinomycetota bacterium]
MPEEQVSVEIAAAPADVWAVVGDFGGIGEFLEGIDSFRLEGDDRVIGMFGLEIRERLVSRDDEARTITYSVVDGVPIERHEATIAVSASGDGSLVTWSFDVAPAEMAPVFAETYTKALQSLGARFA